MVYFFKNLLISVLRIYLDIVNFSYIFQFINYLLKDSSPWVLYLLVNNSYRLVPSRSINFLEVLLSLRHFNVTIYLAVTPNFGDLLAICFKIPTSLLSNIVYVDIWLNSWSVMSTNSILVRVIFL